MVKAVLLVAMVTIEMAIETKPSGIDAIHIRYNKGCACIVAGTALVPYLVRGEIFVISFGFSYFCVNNLNANSFS